MAFFQPELYVFLTVLTEKILRFYYWKCFRTYLCSTLRAKLSFYNRSKEVWSRKEYHYYYIGELTCRMIIRCFSLGKPIPNMILGSKTDFAFLYYNPKIEINTPNRFLRFSHTYTRIILSAQEHRRTIRTVGGIVMSRATCDLMHLLYHTLRSSYRPHSASFKWSVEMLHKTQNFAPFDPKCWYNVRKMNKDNLLYVLQ